MHKHLGRESERERASEEGTLIDGSVCLIPLAFCAAENPNDLGFLEHELARIDLDLASVPNNSNHPILSNKL